MVSERPEMDENGEKMVQASSKMVPNRTKIVQDAFRICSRAKTWLQVGRKAVGETSQKRSGAKCSNLPGGSAGVGKEGSSKRAQGRPKMAELSPKTAPRYRQDGP